MLVYTPWPAERFGSLEQAIRECEGLLLLLREPETTAKIFAAIPQSIQGICEQPAQPAVNCSVDVDADGKLRLIAVEGAVQPGAEG